MAKAPPPFRKYQNAGVRVTAAGRALQKQFNARPRVTKPTVDPVHPNVGVGVAYHRRLEALVTEMHDSVTYWTRQKYKAAPPVLAQDASPAQELRKLMRKLARRWQRNFDQLAQEMAEHFAHSALERSDKSLENALRKAGWTVKFQTTPAQRDAFAAVVGENVGLIRSIPQRYLGDVEGEVMRSVSQGRDLSEITSSLSEKYGITRRRAALIARTQNNMATAVFVRVRQKELGITEALWIHSHGGKEPRPSHLANDGKPYNVDTGWYDPDEEKFIRPGELIQCRCVSRSIIPGFG